MARKLDYGWHLRQVMADRGLFATTDLIQPLARRGIRLSSSQVCRLVVERPERLSLKVLMALLDVLDCIPRRRPASTRRARRRHRGGALDGPPGAQHRRPAPAGAHPDGPGVRVQFVTENLAFTDCR